MDIPTPVESEISPFPAARIMTEQWSYSITKPSILIGRYSSNVRPGDVANDIQLNDHKSVSRHHAKISYNMSTHTWELMCLGRNGVRVNGFQYEADETAPIALQGS